MCLKMHLHERFQTDIACSWKRVFPACKCPFKPIFLTSAKLSTDLEVVGGGLVFFRNWCSNRLLTAWRGFRPDSVIRWRFCNTSTLVSYSRSKQAGIRWLYTTAFMFFNIFALQANVIIKKSCITYSYISSLYCKSFTIVICDRNDSGLWYKTTLLENLALAESVNYDHKVGCKLKRTLRTKNYDLKTYVVQAKLTQCC